MKIKSHYVVMVNRYSSYSVVECGRVQKERISASGVALIARLNRIRTNINKQPKQAVKHRPFFN